MRKHKEGWKRITEGTKKNMQIKLYSCSSEFQINCESTFVIGEIIASDFP